MPAQIAKPKRASARLAQLDALQVAINNLRFEANRGNVDYDTADMREFLLAAYAMTEIDALWNEAQAIFVPTEDLYGNPIPSAAARAASHAFDEVML